jgi:Bacterial Ig-like domain (group 3)
MTKLRLGRSIGDGETGINRAVTRGPQTGSSTRPATGPAVVPLVAGLATGTIVHSWRRTVAPFLVAVTVLGALSLTGGLANAAPADSLGSPYHPSSSAASASNSMATSTVLTTSPASPVTPGTLLTLTATVTPATAVGTVQFKDGTTNLGDPVAVSKGIAAGTISTLPLGSHQMTAAFTPADAAVFNPSTSAARSVVVANSTGSPTTGSPVTGPAPTGPAPAGPLPIGSLPIGPLPIQPPVTGPAPTAPVPTGPSN